MAEQNEDPAIHRAGGRVDPVGASINVDSVQDRKKPKDKKSPAAAYIATAYKQHPESGMVLTWVWHENPSSEIARMLSSLCGEVPYLGEACSVVELRTHEDYGFPVDAGKYVWTLSTDSALTSILALGHVWRDSYVPQTDATSREERYWDLVDAIKSKTSHFRIFDWHAVYRVNMTDYAHHADSSNVLHGMQALVAISDGADSLDCAAMAIGQSRHLGGGLWCRLIFT